MTINNQNRAAWIKLFYYLLIFLYLATTIVLIYLQVKPIYPIVGAISFFVILCIAFSLLLNLNFIIYKESETKVILRYYPLHPFHHQFKSIEISKNTLSHFDLDMKLFGLRPEITLYQQTERGLAKYPSVSISSLSKSSRKEIINSLQKNSLKK
ncbi:hypothetical protein BZG02_17310 [Labilibaculum filiforme]|uniref:Uncharacterized protein n=1 Tax=Labilibaculum filiforme TaxID=1940526 RepID=A0A2N3HSM4_9BACT|nr:hypothetical protein [Labilibaculum filiforme]PKQ61051.1 hypothetical protein BZG02_17310 [Labilibaculum filiforme]